MTMIALALLLSAAQTPVAAPPTPQAAGATLQRFQERRRARIMRQDANRDGRVSASEFAAAAKDADKAARRFGRLDTNRDGLLDAAEIDALAARRFARMDADGDGRLARDERPQRRAAAVQD